MPTNDSHEVLINSLALPFAQLYWRTPGRCEPRPGRPYTAEENAADNFAPTPVCHILRRGRPQKYFNLRPTKKGLKLEAKDRVGFDPKKAKGKLADTYRVLKEMHASLRTERKRQRQVAQSTSSASAAALPEDASLPTVFGPGSALDATGNPAEKADTVDAVTAVVLAYAERARLEVMASSMPQFLEESLLPRPEEGVSPTRAAADVDVNDIGDERSDAESENSQGLKGMLGFAPWARDSDGELTRSLHQLALRDEAEDDIDISDVGEPENDPALSKAFVWHGEGENPDAPEGLPDATADWERCSYDWDRCSGYSMATSSMSRPWTTVDLAEPQLPPLIDAPEPAAAAASVRPDPDQPN